MNVSRKDSHAVVPLVPPEAITFLDTLLSSRNELIKKISKYDM